jgi:hypothetical protein
MHKHRRRSFDRREEIGATKRKPAARAPPAGLSFEKIARISLDCCIPDRSERIGTKQEAEASELRCLSVGISDNSVRHLDWFARWKA